MGGWKPPREELIQQAIGADGGRGCGLEDQPKTLDKKTVQHNVDDNILTKQFFSRAQRKRAEDWKLV